MRLENYNIFEEPDLIVVDDISYEKISGGKDDWGQIMAESVVSGVVGGIIGALIPGPAIPG